MRIVDRLSTRRARVFGTLAVLLVVAIGVAQVLLIGDYQVDDAYISFAYAKNLAAGHGLTYGAGQHVEGYSNFLWTVLAGLVQLVAPAHLYQGMRVVGFACLLSTLLFTFKLSARYTSKVWAWLPVVLLACATDLTGAVLSALETIGYVAALTVTVALYLTEDRRRRRASGWGMLALGLVRIDGLVHIAFLLGWTGLIWLLERRRPRVREMLHWLAAPALLYAAYFAWRYHYYGLPLPTTYYAKALIPELLPDRGLEYVWGATQQLGLLVVGAFGLFGLLRRPRRERFLLALLVLYHLAYIRHVGGDWMPFHRFILPILPFTAVLFGWGAYEIWQLAQRLALRGGLAVVWPVRVVVAFALLGAAGYVALLQDGHSLDTAQEKDDLGLRTHVAKHTHALVEASRLYRWINRKPGERLTTDYGGVFGYYTDAAIIEMWGLCNADIALRGNTEGINPIYGKTCVECYRDFQPDYFHAEVPLVRSIDAYHSHAQVVGSIFQSYAIGRVLDLTHGYVTGRIVDRSRGEAFYFIERKRAGADFETRHPAPGIDVEYPFEK